MGDTSMYHTQTAKMIKFNKYACTHPHACIHMKTRGHTHMNMKAHMNTHTHTHTYI